MGDHWLRQVQASGVCRKSVHRIQNHVHVQTGCWLSSISYRSVCCSQARHLQAESLTASLAFLCFCRGVLSPALSTPGPGNSETGLLSCLLNVAPNRGRAGQKGSLADSSASITARPGCSSQPSSPDEDKMQEASALCSIQSNLFLSEKTSHSLPQGHTHVLYSAHRWMRDETSTGYVSLFQVPSHPSTGEFWDLVLTLLRGHALTPFPFPQGLPL